MATKLGFVLSLVAVVATICKGHPSPVESQYSYDDPNYDDYSDDFLGEEEEKEISYDINFINSGDTLMVDKGTTIRLPCNVDKYPENFVLMWRKHDESNPNNLDFIAMGNTKLKGDNRISVEIEREGPNKGSTLVIGLANKEDAGQYICQLGSTNGKEQKHTVLVRDPPSITKKPSNGLYKAHKGDDVFLSCEGKGSPEPTITWTRMNKKLPDGQSKIEATELSFKNVNRHHSGTYVCTADNGFGKVVKEKIQVEVEYAPEVEVEEYFIHATETNKVELVCNVHAHPQATVVWMKNSVELTDDYAKLEKVGHRHTLTIPSIKNTDFGNYTCRAKNIHGESYKVLEVSGLAGYADFKSSPRGHEPQSYNLEWTSESQSDIEEFELNWREEGGNWEGFTVPSYKLNSYNWSGKYAFTNLKPATRYEAKVLAKNTIGWSRPCPTFHFATFGAEPYTREVGSATQISTSLASLFLSFIVLYLINC